MNEAVVAAAGRNRKNLIVQNKIMNALDWETTSEILHCWCSFQRFYAAAFLFLLVSCWRCIRAKLSKLLKSKRQQSKPGNNLTTTTTAPCVDARWASELLFQPLWNLSRMWIFAVIIFFCQGQSLNASGGVLNTQSFHEERAKGAVFC